MSDISHMNPEMATGLLYACIALAAAVLFLAVIVILNVRNITRLNERYNSFMRGKTSDGASLEELLNDCLCEVQEFKGALQTLKLRVSALERQVPGCFQKLAVVRYNPFDDTGGDLSYAIALLDETNSGFIINGIYSRAGSYTYAKEIENGVSEKYKLSPEELEALQMAVNSTVETRLGRD